jgi:hypothetical protein
MESRTPSVVTNRVPHIQASPSSASTRSTSSFSSRTSGRKRGVRQTRSSPLNDEAIVNLPRVLGEITLRSDESFSPDAGGSRLRALKHKKSFSADAEPFVPAEYPRSRSYDTGIDSSTWTHVSMSDYTDSGHHISVTERPRSPCLVPPSVIRHLQKHLSRSDVSSHNHIAENKTQSFLQGETNGGLHQALYDPYVTQPTMTNPSHAPQQPQINPYAQESAPSGSTSYYQNSTFAQPIQYHLYTSLGPHREALLPYQRAAHDFFIPDNLREELQRKSATTLQTLPSVYCATWGY